MFNQKAKLVPFMVLLILTSLLAIPQSAEGQDQLNPEPIAVESYSALPFLHSPSLSPDGTKLAVLVTKGDAKHIGIIDLSAPKESEPKYYSIGENELNWFHWAGSKQLLISFGSARNLVFFVYSTNTLKTIDLETSKITSLNEKSEFIKDEIIFQDPYGRYIIAYQYRRGKPYAVRIDLSDASEVVLEKPRHQIDQWIADNKGNIRAGINYSKKRWRLYYREQPGGELVKIENRRYDSFEDGVVEDLQFLPETGQAIILTNGKNGRFGAYKYSIREDIIGDAIYEHPTADVTNLVMDSSKNLIGVEYDADKPGQKWLVPELEDLYQRIGRVFKTKQNRILGTSSDRSVTLFWSGSGSDPGSYYLYYPQLKKIEQVLIPYNKIDPDKMVAMEPVKYQSRDGHMVPAYLTMPNGSKKTDLPTVILPHGGPFMRTSWRFDPWAQLLANRGYVVLQPNFRGSTGYGRDYVEKGYDQWGTGMIDDIDDGADWLIEQGIADKNKVCIMGASYGGYAALWGSIRQPEKYKCAISLNGVTDVRAMLKYDRKQFAARRYARKWEEKVAGEEKKDLEAISPVKQAARMKVPVLVAQGLRDTNVPKEQAYDFVKALDKAGFDKLEKIYFPKSGHDFANSADSTNFLKKSLQFLATHNPSAINSDPQAEDLKIEAKAPEEEKDEK
ncbi:S9 family peptidase [Parasphingorhabdus sp.]|uniref:alpha/beta hydrolase family protein n=1 Tax=Parasphingorhabdus sp. TaxID=2709688 RepID=UPI003298ED00